MKKIVSVLLVLTLVIGAAFAQDITLNFRSKASVLTANDGNTSWFNFTDGNYKNLSDSTKIKVEGEKSGAELAFNLNASGIEKINTYNGWMKFGDLKLGAGTWKDGLLDGNYRVKKDVDASSCEGIDFESCKLGTVFKKTGITFVDDMVNFKGGSATNYAAYAEYKAKLSDDIGLNVFLSGITNAWSSEVKEGKTTAVKSGYAARLQFNMKGLFNSEFIFKSATKDDNALAFFIQPKMVKGLDATLGFSMSFADADKGLMGIDLRARYAVNKQLSFTTFNNISFADKGAQLELNKPLATTGAWKKADTAMWNVIAARYVINDMFAAYFNAGFLSDLSEGSENGVQMRFTPGIQIFAEKSAFINIGLAFSTVAGVDNAFTTEIPVIFRVKF